MQRQRVENKNEDPRHVLSAQSAVMVYYSGTAKVLITELNGTE